MHKLMQPLSLLADALSAHAQSTRALYQVAQPPTTMQLACRCFECSRSPPGFCYFLHDLAFCVMIGRLLSTFVSHVRIRPLLIMKSWCSRIQCGAERSGCSALSDSQAHLPSGGGVQLLCVFVSFKAFGVLSRGGMKTWRRYIHTPNFSATFIRK